MVHRLLRHARKGKSAARLAATLVALYLPTFVRAAPPAAYGVRTALMPLQFEANKGQADARVQFLARGAGYTLFLTGREAVMVLRGREARQKGQGEIRERTGKCQATGDMGDRASSAPYSSPLSAAESRPPTCRSVLRMKLVGADPSAQVSGIERLPGITNYIQGEDPKKWRTNIATYRKVRYAGIYPRTDLVYYGGEGGLEYDFVVKPGGDPRRLKLAFEGATSLAVAPNGDLVADTPVGGIRWKRPYAYQYVGAKRVEVACAYHLSPSRPLTSSRSHATPPTRAVALTVARYDTSRRLVIDPSLSFSTYVGGSSDDRARAVASDGVGRIYVAGYTISADFPVTPGSWSTTYSGGGRSDGFVTRLSSEGRTMQYSTYVSGTGVQVHAVATDSAGCAYVGGRVEYGFPVTPGSAQFTDPYPGWSNAFVAKLSSDGSSLVYGTYHGGDNVKGLAVDPAGAAYAVGTGGTYGCTITPGAFQTTLGGVYDGFVTKISPDGSRFVYSTYLGGEGQDAVWSIVVRDGCAYVTGSTASTYFPTTAVAFDTTLNSESDCYVAKLSADGASLEYSTYLGPGLGLDIAVDPAGQAYVTGNARIGFPITPGAYDNLIEGFEAFVAVMSPTGASLLRSTCIGGKWTDEGTSIVLLGGRPCIVGTTFGTDFPVTSDAAQPLFGGDRDAFVVVLDNTLQTLVYASFLGGPGNDICRAGASTGLHSVVAIGETNSPIFPLLHPIRTAFAVVDGWCAGFVNLGKSGAMTPVRTGIITDTITLKGFLWRLTDNGWISGRSLAFAVDGVSVGAATTDVNGMAALDWAIESGPTTRSIQVSFAGDASYDASSGAATLTAQMAGTKVYVVDRSAKVKSYVVLKAYLFLMNNTLAPAGKRVSVRLDGTVIGVGNTNTSGCAQFGYTVAEAGGVGSRTISGEFAGDAGYFASANTGKLTVTAGDLYIWPYVRSGKRGISHPLKAYVRSLPDYVIQPGKVITFKVNGFLIGSATAAADGWATVAWSIPAGEPTGAHTGTAEFAGDAWYTPATASATFNVVP